MPLSCPVALPSQNELRKDGGGGGGGGGVARRERAAWAPGPQVPSPAQRPVARLPQRPAPRPSRARPSRVAQGQRGGRHAFVGRGFRLWKMARATMCTFMLLSSAAPSTSSATSCATSSATSSAASFTYPPFTCSSLTCSSFTCHLRASVGGGTRVLGVGSKAALAAGLDQGGSGYRRSGMRSVQVLQAWRGSLFRGSKLFPWRLHPCSCMLFVQHQMVLSFCSFLR